MEIDPCTWQAPLFPRPDTSFNLATRTQIVSNHQLQKVIKSLALLLNLETGPQQQPHFLKEVKTTIAHTMAYKTI